MADSLKSRSGFNLVGGWYKTTAFIVFNCVVLFLLLNLIALLGLKLMSNESQNNFNPYNQANFQKVYPNYSKEEINSLLSETHDRGFIYDPYQGYRERPFKGRYVNVDDWGYRHNGLHQAGIIDSNIVPILLFGGSTTFGYGVADSNTVSAYLDRMVKKKNTAYCIFNFGAGGYYSDQELIFFKRVLAGNIKPAIAIFIDGLNEFRIRGEDPLFADEIRKLLGTMRLSEDISEPQNSWFFLSKLPVLQLFYKITASKNDRLVPKEISPDKGEIDKLINRYKTNCRFERAIADANGIKTIFLIQPVPYYNYDISYHVFKNDPMLKDTFIRAGYSSLSNSLADTSLSFLWLGDIQKTSRENFYADDVHYNSKMSQMIAEKIFQKIDSIIPYADGGK